MQLSKRFLDELTSLTFPPKKTNDTSYFGYHCVFTPEEIIHAAKFTPVRIFPKANNANCDRSCLHARSCDFAKRILENFNDGNFKYLKGTVFTQCCDTLRAVFDILTTTHNNLYYLETPISIKEWRVGKKSLDLDYFSHEFKAFGNWLEKKYNIQITEEDIANSQTIYQKNRTLIKELTRFYENGAISTTDYFLALRVGYYVRKEKHNDILKGLLQILIKETKKKSTPSGIPIMILGSINANHMPWIEYFETLGIRIIAEDLCDFSRYNIENPITTITDPYKQLVLGISKKNCPAKLVAKNKVKSIYKRYQRYGAKGIIFMIYQYCDIQAVDYTKIKTELSANNVPTLLLHPTVHFDPSSQMDTRVEAFLEMVRTR